MQCNIQSGLTAEKKREIALEVAKVLNETLDSPIESMVEQGYGVTLATKATSQSRFPGVAFLPVLDEQGTGRRLRCVVAEQPRPALRDFLNLAKKAVRQPRTSEPSTKHPI